MKKKGFFVLSDNNYFLNNNAGNGVRQKIESQIDILNSRGLECSVINLPQLAGKRISKIYQLLRSSIYIDVPVPSADFFYIRRIFPVNKSLLVFLSDFKKKNKNSVIIYEIPTYPYDLEHDSLVGRVLLLFDKIYRKKLKKIVDVMVTYSKDKFIFGVPTIQIVNGVDCSSIPLITKDKSNDNEIHLIAVAQFSQWHGYDRLLSGLNKYYKSCTRRKVLLHFVGDGPSLKDYQQFVKLNNLDDYVFFYGRLSGDELNNVFNKADIAVCSLGCHRINIFLGSFLKSREYLARGLPMISSTKIDVISENYPYCLYVAEDDSMIDIDRVISYYDELVCKETRDKQIRVIRRFAEDNCDLSVVFEPVLEFIRRR